MKRKLSTTEKVRRMIDQGHTNKAIIEKLGIKPQTVYNVRYQINKARGLGAIGALPKPTEGIGEPPKRRYTRRVKAGTGITLTATPHPLSTPARGDLNPNSLERVEVDLPITMIEPPTLWERIKRFFKRG